MDCEWTEKVSALVDEELNEQEAESLREHINACAICKEAEDEFLLLRREIKSYAVTESLGARNATLKQMLGSENVPLWKKRVALPVPALVLLLLALISAGIWMGGTRLQSNRTPVASLREERKPVVQPAPATASEKGIDMARFDHGGRAVIYKVRRVDSADAGQ